MKNRPIKNIAIFVVASFPLFLRAQNTLQSKGVVVSTPIEDVEEVTFSSKSSLTAKNNISDQATVGYFAKDKIVLSEGFSAPIGSTVEVGLSEDAENTEMLSQEISTVDITSPNPSTGSVVLANIATGAEIIISDVTGKTILTATADESSVDIDLSGYPNGVYVIEVTSESETKTGKVFIQH